MSQPLPFLSLYRHRVLVPEEFEWVQPHQYGELKTPMQRMHWTERVQMLMIVALLRKEAVSEILGMIQFFFISL